MDFKYEIEECSDNELIDRHGIKIFDTESLTDQRVEDIKLLYDCSHLKEAHKHTKNIAKYIKSLDSKMKFWEEIPKITKCCDKNWFVSSFNIYNVMYI
jgi:hypothetical protein